MLRPLVFTILLAVLAQGQVPAQTFFPASIPLAVRSPYLSAWQVTTNISEPLPLSVPTFWDQNSVLGWQGAINVDGNTYNWLGNRSVLLASEATVTNVQITPTRSIYSMTAGPMSLTVTFLSPIEPSDWVLQSLPFSYLSINATATDGKSHTVQLYSDITAEWASGNRNSTVSFGKYNTDATIYHQIGLQTPTFFSETNNQANDGEVYYAMPTGSEITWQIDFANVTRNWFSSNGILTNTSSATSGAIGPDIYAFAFSVNLGTITGSTEPVTWTVGRVRDPSIHFTTASGDAQNRRPYFVTEYNSTVSALDAFVAGYSTAYDRAIELDEKITSEAANVSSEYVDLVSLVARQTLGSLDITVFSDSDGNLNASDVMVFMKDIGASRLINPVERMYEGLSGFLYFNASLCSAMLRPLLDVQDVQTDQNYAFQDLGAFYPATQSKSSRTSSTYGVDTTASMLIMLYASTKISGDATQAVEYYAVAKRWADYLVQNTTMPNMNGQQPVDQEANNLVNLALKSIVAVKAMSEISRLAGQDSDASMYQSQASSLLSEWQPPALSSDGNEHILGVFGAQESWALTYNLYYDTLLETGVIPQSILEIHTQDLATRISSAPQFGLPPDSTEGTKGSSVYLLLTAAVMTNATVRDQLAEGVWKRAGSNITQGAFLDYYNLTTGAVLGTSGTAGPSLGAMFSHLALNLQNATGGSNGTSGGGTNTPGPSSDGHSGDSSKYSNTGAIVGGVLGGLAVLAIAAGSVVYLRRTVRSRAHVRASVNLTYNTAEAAPGALSPSWLSPSLNRDSGATGRDRVGAGACVPQSPVGEEGIAARPGPTKAREAQLDAAWRGPDNSASSGTLRPTDSSRYSTEPVSPRTQSVLGSGEGARTEAGMESAFSLSTTEVVGLRAEVQALRRVVLTLNEGRSEQPPEYSA